MAMNDEETVALIAGGHTFGKAHGAASDPEHVGPRAGGCRHRGAGLRLEEQLRQRQGRRHDHQRPGGRWTTDPTEWDNNYFENLFGYEWELTKSPAGAHQWTPRTRGAGHRARRARPVEAARSDDGDDRHRADRGPGLQGDLEALLREPGRARRRVRPGVVQAATPRHGACLAVPRPVGSGRGAARGRTRSPRSGTS